MNLLLLEPQELGPTGLVRLHDERAVHLRKVLRSAPGDRIRVGVIDGSVGSGEILQIDKGEALLQCTCDAPPPPRGEDTLLLAFPRPKVLLRCLEHATALGFGQIVLFRSRRVEKSHLHSHSVTEEVVARALRHGLSQSRRTYLPRVGRFERFGDLLGSFPPTDSLRHDCFVADPEAPTEAAFANPLPGPMTLLIGPEGGLIDHELERLVAHGFRLVRAGYQPLRVESAVSYLTGQLRAARSLGALSATAADDRPRSGP